MREIPVELKAKLAAGGRDLTLLLVRLGAMGDIVRTVPALRCIRQGLPAAKIHWIVDPPWIQLLEGDRDLASCLRFPRKELRESHLRTMRALRGTLRGLGIDATVDFHGNLRSGVLAFLSAAPTRFGYGGHQQKEGNRWWTTRRLPAGARRASRIERNLALTSLLGIQPAAQAARLDGDLPIFARGADEAAQSLARLDLAARGSTGRSFAVISPGASVSQAYKRPPAEVLAAAARRADDFGLRPLVVWGPGERPDAEAVCRALDRPDWLAHPTGLAELAALIRSAALFVGGDSGPMHLACAAATPVVAIFGPTDPRVNRPWGTEYEVVSAPDERYRGLKRHDRKNGFDGVTADGAAAAVDGLLRRLRASAAGR